MYVCMFACMNVCMYACMHVCMYACMKAHSDTHGVCPRDPVGVCVLCSGWGSFWGCCAVFWVLALGSMPRAAMDSTTSSRNKIRIGQGLGLCSCAIWILCLSFVNSGPPQQGRPATTIASGRTAVPAGLLYRSFAKQYSADALSAGLHLDIPGRVRLTGSPTLGLHDMWQTHWAHNFSGSMPPLCLHLMLASGAYSRSVTITHCLLLLFSDRFKLQSLAKYMFTLETQNATFLPPLPMTHANSYDFPQKPLTQINLTGIRPAQFRSLSGLWHATSIWTLWTDFDVHAKCPCHHCVWMLQHQGKQLTVWALLCLSCMAC